MLDKAGILRTMLAAGLLFGGTSVAQAEYPEKQVRVIAPYLPGGGSDLVARAMASRLSKRLGQPFVVDNVTGAAGMIAAEALVKSAPDGYTIMVDALGLAINPSIFKTSYDAKKDIAPVAKLGDLPFILVTNPNVPYKSVAELIAETKAKPGRVPVAAAGNSTRMAAEVFRIQAGIQFAFIPYRGGAQANTAILSGETPIIFSDLPSVAPYVDSGQMTALGVSSPERWPSLPKVPTIAEAGLPGYNVMSWYAVFAPAKTPQAIINRLNKEIVEIVQEPDMVAQLEKLGARPGRENVDQFTTFFHTELDRWAEINKQAGVKPQ